MKSNRLPTPIPMERIPNKDFLDIFMFSTINSYLQEAHNALNNRSSRVALLPF